MKGLFIPDITAEMFRSGCLESIEALMAEGKIYDVDYEPEPCVDTISRQAVIKAIDKHTFDTDEGLCLDEDITCILEEIPSTQPEPKKGKWIKLYAGNYKCSVCGVWFANDDDEMVEDFKYCPNCGAKMEVEDDGKQ